MDPVRNECWDWLDEIFNLNVVRKCRTFQATLNCGKVAFGSTRKKLVYQAEKLQTKVPDRCKVFIVRSLVPRDLEKDLLKVHPTTNYKATKEYILEQASLKRDAHFDDKGKQDKLVPMEVDALLAKVSALKDARGVGGEAGGTEPHGHDSCEGGSHRQEEETWTDHTLNTFDQIERELMALKANKGEKGHKGGKGNGFQGNCNKCGKYGHRLSACWVEDQDMKAKGGSWSNKGGGTGPKGQGSLHSGQQINNGHWKGTSTVWEAKGGAWNHAAKGGVWGGGQGIGHPGKGGAYWFDGVSPQGGSQDGGAWQAVSSNPWTSKLFLLDDKPPRLELLNSFGALARRGKFNTKTQQVQHQDTETKEGSTETTKDSTPAEGNLHA